MSSPSNKKYTNKQIDCKDSRWNRGRKKQNIKPRWWRYTQRYCIVHSYLTTQVNMGRMMWKEWADSTIRNKNKKDQKRDVKMRDPQKVRNLSRCRLNLSQPTKSNTRSKITTMKMTCTSPSTKECANSNKTTQATTLTHRTQPIMLIPFDYHIYWWRHNYPSNPK